MPHFEKTVVKLPWGGCASTDPDEVRSPRAPVVKWAYRLVAVAVLVTILAML